MRQSLKTPPRLLSSSSEPDAIPQTDIHTLTNVRTLLWAMVAVLLLVGWFGLRSVDADALWYDEWWSVYYAGSATQYPDVSPAGTWAKVSAEFHELNPPGYYITLNLWSRLVGTQPAVLRLWSVAMGLLALAFVYRIAADQHTPLAGMFAAALLGTSAFFVEYTHEARAYMQMVALSTMTVAVYWRLHTRSKSSLWLYASLWIGIAGLLYTHYMGVMLLAALGLYHLIFAAKDRHWWWITLTAILAGVAFMPWLFRAFEALSQVDSDSARDFFALAPLELGARTLAHLSNGAALLVAVLAWFALPKGRFLLWIVTITYLLAAIANEQVKFITDVHYMLALFPILAALVGMGIANLPRGQWVVTGLWMGVGTWLVTFPQPLDEISLRQYIAWDDLTEVITPLAGEFDRVVHLVPEPDPRWLHRPVAEFYMSDTPLIPYIIDSPPGKLPIVFEDELRDAANGAERLWISHDTRPAYAPSRYAIEMREWLLQTGDLIDCNLTVETDTLSAGLYVPPVRDGWVAQLSDDLGIGLHQWQPRTLPDRKYTLLVTTTRTANVPSDTYSVSVQVQSDDGIVAYQQDMPLPNAPEACTVVSIPANDLLSGTYSVFGVIYNWQTGERVGPGDTPEDKRIHLTDITIEGETQ
jgi:hypothetical protein